MINFHLNKQGWKIEHIYGNIDDHTLSARLKYAQNTVDLLEQNYRKSTIFMCVL